MLLNEIKRKKEYKNLDDDFVSRVIVSFSGKYELPKQKKELMKLSGRNLEIFMVRSGPLLTEEKISI